MSQSAIVRGKVAGLDFDGDETHVVVSVPASEKWGCEDVAILRLSAGLELTVRVRDSAGLEDDWQPIATAPQDGTFVLTTIAGGYRPAISHFATYEGRTRWGNDPETFMEEDHFLTYWLGCLYEPIHWRPLPVAP